MIQAIEGPLVGKHSAVLAQLGDRESSSILEAQVVIESIRAAKGYLEEDFLHDYRFLYEVVQNADDSHYRNIFKQGGSAFLRFTITPKTLDIETNEDGFTRANVEAICATGKSSKKASATEDFTGEKGFGFKSVFSIAEEVRIQSGVWSFRFEHR
ncbi:hypothetical protein EJ07DRAFT_159316 [Lizonia empirigonia]|nr:hypothetical protein EJ07DRAFT_159316 [Lizonia empirigonia]